MELKLRYGSPAPDSAEGWERYSLPLGCSHMGINVFGGVEKERLQITENSLENDGRTGGLNNFAEIFLRFPHTFEEAGQYERGLLLNDGTAFVKYEAGGVHVEREYFASYPDRAFAGRITASAPLDLDIWTEIPYLNDDAERAKTGTVTAEGNTVTLRGTMKFFGVRFEGQLRAFTDGCMEAKEGRLCITGATDTRFVFCCGTNYELRPEVFTQQDPKKKLRDFDPHDRVTGYLEAAAAKSYETLRERHLADFRSLFGRVELELGETEVPEAMTDELLKAYGAGTRSRYLEVLYFQYGRYLLLSSSRPGCLPANLQGVWNCHDFSPWGSGYWHNINVQMNYWPAFVTNLAETFEAYRDYNLAFRRDGERRAREFIRKYIPENDTEEPGECGWTIGTGAYSYLIDSPGGHSGPGTGGLTTKLFWEYYEFTGDTAVLRQYVYPTLLSMAKHLVRCVREYDGLYLSAFSASPEQIIANNFVNAPDGSNMTQYYHTVGCAFDQQMILENGKDLLRCVEILGEETLPEKDRAFLAVLRRQIGHYDPVQVGWSGQIKEYREEHFYGEVGEYRHRHISQLVGLYPGTVIGTETPAWLDAAKVTLNYRSDESTGWALAHRLNTWARTGDGSRAYRLYANLLGLRTLPNLWDTHPPFQIDGNFGGCSGVAEMLLQSHEGFIAPLACLPEAWQNGSYRGLCARGGFELDVKWEKGCAVSVTVRSKNGGECRLKYPGIAGAAADFAFTAQGRDLMVFGTEAGKEYRITAIPRWEKKPVPGSLAANRRQELRWEFDGPVNVWRAVDSAPSYVCIGENITGGSYTDREPVFETAETVTYKITRADARDGGADGAWVTLNHSTPIQRDRYRMLVRQLNVVSGGAETPEWLGE